MVDDYIRREDMLNAVEKLDIIPSVDGMGIPTDTEDFRVQFLGTVLKVEPADVAPIVWCKDCQYLDTVDDDVGICHHVNGFGGVMPKDGFCSKGERRGE